MAKSLRVLRKKGQPNGREPVVTEDWAGEELENLRDDEPRSYDEPMLEERPGLGEAFGRGEQGGVGRSGGQVVEEV